MEKYIKRAKEIYGMGLGDWICFDSNSSWLRVPGGWVYGDLQGTTFIPFNNEYMKLLTLNHKEE
jgi:hypothetical protein